MIDEAPVQRAGSGTEGTAVVIGGGLLGLFSALYLRKRRWQVVVLDRDGLAPGCSDGNAGWIVPSFSEPIPRPARFGDIARWAVGRGEPPLLLELRTVLRMMPWVVRFLWNCRRSAFEVGFAALAALNRSTMELFDELEQDGVDFEMHDDGLLFAFLDRQELEASFQSVSRLQDYGFDPPELLSADRLRELEPALHRRVAGGFFLDSERHVRPESLLRGLKQRLVALGVELRPGEAVHGFAGSSPTVREAETEGGAVRGDVFVLAAGVWSRELAGTLGKRLPVRAGKGYSVTWPGVDLGIRRPIYLGDAHVAISPYRDASRISGLMELSDADAESRVGRTARLMRAARPYFGGEFRRENLDVESGSEWMGLRPLTPDGLPVIGRLPDFHNVFVATGHGMLGLTLGPVTGRAIANLIDTGRTEVDLSPFTPDRFK